MSTIDPREEWARAEASAKRGKLEAKLAQQIHAMKLPAPVREFVFDPRRRWRVDFAWPSLMTLAEIEGLTHEGGRHQRKAGFEKDALKYAAAQMLGFQVLRITPGMVHQGVGVQFIANMLAIASRRR